MHAVQRHGCSVVLDVLREGVRESREPPHAHPHREILPLYVAGADMPFVGIADLGLLLRPGADRGAVALLAFHDIVAVYLDQHGVVDVGPEAVRDGREVTAEAVGGELDAMGEPGRKVLNELRSAAWIAFA